MGGGGREGTEEGNGRGREGCLIESGVGGLWWWLCGCVVVWLWRVFSRGNEAEKEDVRLFEGDGGEARMKGGKGGEGTPVRQIARNWKRKDESAG